MQVNGEKDSPKLVEIHWEGNSREVLAGFPEEIRGGLGFALYELQLGRQPSIATRRMGAQRRGAPLQVAWHAWSAAIAKPVALKW